MASNLQPHLRWLGLGDLTSQTSVAFSVSLLRCTPVALSSTYASHPDLWNILDTWPLHQGAGSFKDTWKPAPLNEDDIGGKLTERAIRELAAPLYAMIRDRAAELQEDIVKGGSLAAAALNGSVEAQDKNVARHSHTLQRMGVLDCILATLFSGSGLAEPTVVPVQVDHKLRQGISADDARLKKYYDAGIRNWRETLKTFCNSWEAHLLQQSRTVTLVSDNAAESLLQASSEAYTSKLYATNEMNLYDLAVALQVLSSVSSSTVTVN